MHAGMPECDLAAVDRVDSAEREASGFADACAQARSEGGFTPRTQDGLRREVNRLSGLMVALVRLHNRANGVRGIGRGGGPGRFGAERAVRGGKGGKGGKGERGATAARPFSLP